MDLKKKIDDFAYELEEDGVEAVVVFASNETLLGAAGPMIIPTMEPRRVVVVLNELIFRARVDGLTARFTQERPEVDPSAIAQASLYYMLEAMVSASRLQVAKYAAGLDSVDATT